MMGATQDTTTACCLAATFAAGTSAGPIRAASPCQASVHLWSCLTDARRIDTRPTSHSSSWTMPISAAASPRFWSTRAAKVTGWSRDSINMPKRRDST
ncbi:hypothetical protein CONLIGDRAFT_107458 [Coniochaeta ligniaria NRRL 30616]|uniref:Uncharacterized protein n=1 Tax=Coniochaeta ligniaria NRRL 30616 TaxID=1408157 RepID=A0A1J7J2V2_9PEZI|nr:hypothetical protein CONLIGDRAFT_107458 [Coniochaeta ligniaria NRRL 30616]